MTIVKKLNRDLINNSSVEMTNDFRTLIPIVKKAELLLFLII